MNSDSFVAKMDEIRNKKKEEKEKIEEEKEIQIKKEKKKYLTIEIPKIIEEIQNYFLNGNDYITITNESYIDWNRIEENIEFTLFYICFDDNKVKHLLPFSNNEFFDILKENLKGLKISKGDLSNKIFIQL